MYRPFQVKETELTEKLKNEVSEMKTSDKISFISSWLTENSRKKPKYMIYLIMYDIENNKIRTNIAKYLIKKGCIRIQKSVYLIRATGNEVKDIGNTLKEINEIYENFDSIIILPVPQEKFQNLRMIGKNITFEVIIRPKKVMVF